MKICGLSGKKQSGKNTSANYLTGFTLKKYGQIKDFRILDDGSLNVLADYEGGGSNWGILDLERKDQAFIEAAEETIWPFVKCYSFADTLKSLSVNLFNLNPDQVWGTNEEKNSLTHLKWEDMPGNVKVGIDYTESTNSPYASLEPKKRGYMTGREFLQYFGTEICRKIYEPVWINATLNKIKKEGSGLAIITDVRFPSEVESILSSGGYVYMLDREIYKDDHESENALNRENFNWDKFTAVINNNKLTINKSCDLVLQQAVRNFLV